MIEGLMMDTPLLLSSIIEYAATCHGRTEVVSRTMSGETIRYGYADAHARILRMGAALGKLGMGDSDRVATLCWNTRQHFELFYAVPCAGGILHTVNPRLSIDHVAYIINHGGAEILVDRVRDIICPKKGGADDWLEPMREAHKLGIRSSATMMFGHVETLEERIEHMDRLRTLQDETGGFTAFICWTFQPENTDMADVPKAGAFEYLKTQAVSRLYLDNVVNIQSSWVTQGEKVGQLALKFGANDMGSLMIEENVVSQAGTVYNLSLDTIRRCIREAGYLPRQRNVFYEYVDRPEELAV